MQVCHLQTLTQLGGQTFAHLLAYKFDKVMNSDWPLEIVYREKSFFYDGESRHFMVLHILYRKFKRQHMHLYNDFIYLQQTNVIFFAVEILET